MGMKLGFVELGVLDKSYESVVVLVEDLHHVHDKAGEVIRSIRPWLYTKYFLYHFLLDFGLCSVAD